MYSINALRWIQTIYFAYILTLVLDGTVLVNKLYKILVNEYPGRNDTSN